MIKLKFINKDGTVKHTSEISSWDSIKKAFVVKYKDQVFIPSEKNNSESQTLLYEEVDVFYAIPENSEDVRDMALPALALAGVIVRLFLLAILGLFLTSCVCGQAACDQKARSLFYKQSVTVWVSNRQPYIRFYVIDNEKFAICSTDALNANIVMLESGELLSKKKTELKGD